MTYDGTHADSHESRTMESLKDNFREKESENLTHVNSVRNESIFVDMPYFDSTKQLTQDPRYFVHI